MSIETVASTHERDAQLKIDSTGNYTYVHDTINMPPMAFIAALLIKISNQLYQMHTLLQ